MNKEAAKAAKATDPSSETSKKLTCGIVMPISEIDGCPSSHWSDVRSIIIEAAENAGFEAKLVSESEDIGVIQARIVQNIYDADIVVCDVSGKNANVMFELGLRLAFDKPAIVLKDDQTSYSFDTSPIEHLEYPRDLRYNEIIDLKKKLASRLKATLEASTKAEYQSFLKHFGKFKVTGLETKEIDKEDFILAELKSMKSMMGDLQRSPVHIVEFGTGKAYPSSYTYKGLKTFPSKEVNYKNSLKNALLSAVEDLGYGFGELKERKEELILRMMEVSPSIVSRYGGEDSFRMKVENLINILAEEF
ncbi:RNA helicase [Celeribacter ethanolicus]|uniref:RNA helicase n=1 Tax=Celeribacter ethanolicus TaxID=1758178 RepID=UPI0012DF9C4D|nr:RNA helicase [Celeribacter ethanolicus]